MNGFIELIKGFIFSKFKKIEYSDELVASMYGKVKSLLRKNHPHNFLVVSQPYSEKKRLELSLLTGIDIPILDFMPFGSAHVCNPPVTNTDEDYVILVEDMDLIDSMMRKHGFSNCDLYDQISANFTSYRCGKLNFTFTIDDLMYTRYMAATLLATRLNLQNKQQRVRLYALLEHGKDAIENTYYQDVTGKCSIDVG